jgi:hypothetical protein
MLRRIRQLYGKTLRTSDADIGHVKDFYFNDQQWVVRYVIADTGTWLLGRLVLISPHAFGNFHQDGDRLLVNLTRQQIENSPAMESHKPVSRQYEEEYNRYYGWPSQASRGSHLHSGGDPHLRSTQALCGYRNFSGYQIQASDGTIGHANDFIMDDESWAICHLVVETGRWLSRREIVISPKDIDRIGYEESKVFVKVTKEAILAAPEYHAPPLGATYHDAGNFDQ